MAFNTRIQLKADTSTNWAKATTFKPLNGELVIYDPGTENAKLKVGNGSTLVESLPAIGDNKVDKVEGKDLSTNDFTDAYKEKIDVNTKNLEILSSLVGDTSVSEQIGSIIDSTLSIDGAAADAKVVGNEIKTLKSKIFIDTYSNYETAYANGEIPNGTLVIIVEDDVDIGDIDDSGGSSSSTSTSSLLGTGVLGYMILA